MDMERQDAIRELADALGVSTNSLLSQSDPYGVNSVPVFTVGQNRALNTPSMDFTRSMMSSAGAMASVHHQTILNMAAQTQGPAKNYHLQELIEMGRQQRLNALLGAKSRNNQRGSLFGSLF